MMDIFSAFQITVVSIGMCLNMMFVVTMTKRPLQSQLTTILLANQSILDCCNCFMTLLVNVISPLSNNLPKTFNSIFICHIWSSKFLNWVFIEASVQNVVCTATDRYLAVLRPSEYRMSKRHVIVCMAIYIILMSMIIPIPAILQVRIENRSCIAGNIVPGESFQNFVFACSLVWSISVFFGPLTYLAIVYSKIIRRLRRSIVSDITEADKEKFNNTHKLTISVFSATIIFLCTFSLDTVCFILHRWNLVDYTPGNSLERTGVFLLTLNSVVNPISYFILMKKFRYRFYSLFIDKYKNKIKNSL